MMAQIAKFDFIARVIFVNPIQTIRSSLKNIANERGGIRGTLRNLAPSKIHNSIRTYTPIRFFPFKKRYPVLRTIENHIICSVINVLNRSKPFILYINRPVPSLDFILNEFRKKAQLSMFDFSDDFVEYFNHDARFDRAACLDSIDKFAGSSDIILAVNQHIKEKYAYLSRPITVVRNATNYDNFQRKRYRTVEFLEKVAQKGSPVVGYSGGIRDNRIDFDLLDYLIKMKPNWQFVFIGEAGDSFTDRYLKIENVHHFEPVSYDLLPDCINYFDLAFVPFQINEHTKGNDLLKLYDYLAMGKPVVSTKIGGAEDLGDVIRASDNRAEFLSDMESAIARDMPGEVSAKKKVARENSWPLRMQQVEMLIREKLKKSQGTACTA